MEIEKLGEGSFGEVFKVGVPSDKPYHKEHPVAVLKKVEGTGEGAEEEAKLLR